MAVIWEICFHMDVRTIRIIKASSLDRDGLLTGRIRELEAAGFKVIFEDLAPNRDWTWTAGSVGARSAALNQAFLEEESDAVMWARGGYGASDLLDLVPWDQVAKAKIKPIIGFSDVCAVQSALYAITGRQSVHAPMPATTTWKKSGDSDVNELFTLLRGQKGSGSLTATPVGASTAKAEGFLFGGCLSVLTSLIGTRYLPKTLAGHILYFEDIGENPGRIIRMLNQWQQAGLFKGVKGLLLGAFTDLGGDLPDSAPVLLNEVFERYKLPTFASNDFGHIAPNLPIVLGSQGIIRNGKLTWTTGSLVT
jgi:muramoyltetrapeptide carboxypeptidase